MDETTDPTEAYRVEFARRGTIELVEAWEEVMPEAVRAALLEEIRTRSYRIKSLPEAPDYEAGVACTGILALDSDAETPEMGNDGLLRVVGMVMGGGAGSLLLILLSLYSEFPLPLILGLPGIGLTLAAGLSSTRRSYPWGLIAGIAGCVCMVLVLWLSMPTEVHLADLFLQMTTSFPEAGHSFVIIVLGMAVGSGWKK